MAWEDYFDPYSYDDEYPSAECKRCGEGGLHWEEDDGRFILVTQNGGIHKCDQNRADRRAMGDFEAVE